jgi:hypothetical protein
MLAATTSPAACFQSPLPCSGLSNKSNGIICHDFFVGGLPLLDKAPGVEKPDKKMEILLHYKYGKPDAQALRGPVRNVLGGYDLTGRLFSKPLPLFQYRGLTSRTMQNGLELLSSH